MTKTVAVYSVKGGVGKTTLAVNFAYCAAAHTSRRTLLWDIDAQGAASFLCAQERPDAKVRRVFSREVEASTLAEPTKWPMLDLLAADMSLRHLDRMLSDAEKPKRLRKLLQTLSASYDRIILDCPPGLGELSDQLFRAADLVVVPVIPTPIGLRSLVQVQDHIEHNHERRPLLLPVISMVDRRKKIHREFVSENPDWPVIPQASVVERMAVERSPVTAYASNSPAARAISDVWLEVDRRLSSMPKSHGQTAARKLARISKARG